MQFSLEMVPTKIQDELFLLISNTRSRTLFNEIFTSIHNKEITKSQLDTTYINTNWIVIEDNFDCLYEHGQTNEEDKISYPTVQMASKQCWTTDRIFHSNKLD